MDKCAVVAADGPGGCGGGLAWGEHLAAGPGERRMRGLFSERSFIYKSWLCVQVASCKPMPLIRLSAIEWYRSSIVLSRRAHSNEFRFIPPDSYLRLMKCCR